MGLPTYEFAFLPRPWGGKHMARQLETLVFLHSSIRPMNYYSLYCSLVKGTLYEFTMKRVGPNHKAEYHDKSNSLRITFSNFHYFKSLF